MQGSNARKKIVLGLSLGLAVLTGCQNMRSKLQAPKLAMPSVSMPKVKMPNLLAWRDKDESAVLSSTEAEADPPTPSMNATPYAAYGATGNREPAMPRGVSPVSYPATPFPTAPNPMNPAGSGSRNPSPPQTPNYQIGPYGVTTPPQVGTTATTSNPPITTPSSSNPPAGANAYPTTSAGNLAAIDSYQSQYDRNPPKAGGSGSGTENSLTSAWDGASTQQLESPAAAERPPLDTPQVSRWDHLDSGNLPPSVQPLDQSSAVGTPPPSNHGGVSDAAAAPNAPVSSAPVSHDPVANAPVSDTGAVATSSMEQPSAPALATPPIASTAAPTTSVAQISHAGPVSDTTQRPDMNSYSDHVAAQGALAWRPGSTESYAEATAASIAGAIRSATVQAAETPNSQKTSPPSMEGGSWPSTGLPATNPPFPDGQY